MFRGMQLLLFVVLLIGLYERNLGIFVNAAVSLAITFLPAYLARNHNIALGSGTVLWITAAVFLHAVGTLGPYQTTAWWDSVTHVLSASIVAGVGYATVRALDEYDKDIYLPSRFMFLFILLFVMAFGVLWELLEFVISEGAALLHSTTVLTQYGLEDTITDLMFDTAGGIIFAILGTQRVQYLVGSIRERIENHHLQEVV